MALSPGKTASHAVLGDGQSLNFVPVGGPTYLDLMRTNHPTVSVKLVGISGMSWTVLDASRTKRVNPLLAGVTSTVVHIMLGGTSDLYKEEDTAATTYSDFVSYATAVRAAIVAASKTAKIAACTITPSTLLGAPEEAQRVALNPLILADASHAFDATVDLAGDTHLSNNADTTYYSDGTHWTAAGASIAYTLINAAVAGWLP
jgi:hypothetical protein